jgi:thiol-disulfide isomerase/thioredoxin
MPSRRFAGFVLRTLARSLIGAVGLACGATLPGSTAAAAPDAAHPSRPSGIAWFEGDVGDAFDAARAAGKPVFLYWGAAWCPPCQELKTSVFRRRDVLERLNLFVPVYLDGDAPGAQAWGERFRVLGYPTVLVLASDRTELERVSGGLDLQRYAEVLDLALGQDRSARDLLAAVAGGSPALAPDDCRRLAYNAWQLDDGWLLHPEALGPLAASLAQAAQACPRAMAVERARLRLTAVQAAVDAEAKDLRAGHPPSAGLQAALAAVPPILADDRLAPAVGDALWQMPAEYFGAAVAAPGNGGPAAAQRRRTALRERWFARMDALSRDPRYSAAERLDALRSKAIAARALDPDRRIPPDLARSAKARIDRALALEHEPYARASLVNSALNVLDVLGDEERAAAILAGEIRSAAHPYYYMADLAELEEKRGHPDAAVDWLARSFRGAQGPATRFQWGVGYVCGLVRMRPRDDTAIRDAAVAVLAELDAAGDLHGRTRRSLARLETSLRDWNHDATHEAAIAAVRERMQVICGRIHADDPGGKACNGFLHRSEPPGSQTPGNG